VSVYSKFRFLNYVHNRYVGIPTFPNGHLTSNKGGEEITAIKPENCTKYNSNWTVNYYDETPTSRRVIFYRMKKLNILKYS